jgi:hypothetical protein
MINKNTRNSNNNLKEAKTNFRKKKFHFNHKWHCFYMWVLYVEIKSSISISICCNRQYLHVTHTIGFNFGNSKPLQTWC